MLCFPGALPLCTRGLRGRSASSFVPEVREERGHTGRVEEAQLIYDVLKISHMYVAGITKFACFIQSLKQCYVADRFFYDSQLTDGKVEALYSGSASPLLCNLNISDLSKVPAPNGDTYFTASPSLSPLYCMQWLEPHSSTTATAINPQIWVLKQSVLLSWTRDL